jgi:hypothetical protein
MLDARREAIPDWGPTPSEGARSFTCGALNNLCHFSVRIFKRSPRDGNMNRSSLLIQAALATLLATAGFAGAHMMRTSLARTPASGIGPAISPPQGVSFVARLDFPMQQPGAVAFGDFNADGHTDVAVTAAPLNNVSVFLGKGDGTLQTPISYTVAADPIAIAVGDFNGDGKPDIVTANGTSNSVSVLLNQGNGTFQLAPLTNLVIGRSPNGLAVGDFNRDGKLDVAVIVALPQSGASAAEIFLGKGDGTFQPGVNYPFGSATSISVGDFNGDGILDLAAIDGGGISILLGKGDGTFQAPIHTADAGNGPHSLVIGDFNNDGKLDIAVANSELQSFSILLGRGDGTFQSPIQSNQAGTLNSGLVAADFNGDGKLDLIANGSVILLGNGDGTFRELSNVVTGTSGAPGDLAVVDLNGDGKPDLVGLNGQQNFISVLLGIGDGTFQTAETVTPRSVTQSVTADLNGDGKIDLVAVANGELIVLLGNGIGAFGPRKQLHYKLPLTVPLWRSATSTRTRNQTLC